ncbi:hypothetical protein DNJ95_06805 [Stutzerimonas kirkiae]|nr:hypothetical protein DNJ95_06805 [Stutzerimonas kirkiae]
MLLCHRQGASIKALEAGKLDEKNRLPRSFVQPRAFQRSFRLFAVHSAIALPLTFGGFTERFDGSYKAF